jgi:hypothetical protein
MNAQVMIKDNTARAVEVAKAVEATAGALAEALEKKSELLADALEKQADAIGSKTAPIAKAVEVKADALGETLEKARDEAMASLKGFKLGQREAILLGVAVGALAVAVVVRRMDRRAAAERLRAAGTRAGESAQKIGAKVSPAVAALGSKAGELAGQVKEQLRPSNGRHGDEGQAPEYSLPTPSVEGALDEARQRLSAEANAAASDAGAVNPEAAAGEAATSEVGQPAAKGEIKVSDGMKVVAFDGTDIGRVQEVREEVFVLDRPRGADLLVPMDQVARIEGTVVYLRVETGQVSKMGWEKADPT